MTWVPARVIAPERTYSSAVALRDWFREHNTPVHGFNVLTEGPHARRTQLLYEAFGKNVTIGITLTSQGIGSARPTETVLRQL